MADADTGDTPEAAISIVATTDGGPAGQLQVKLGLLPPCPRQMAVNVGGVGLRGDSVEFVFAQALAGTDRLFGAAIVSVPKGSAAESLARSQDFVSKLEDYATQRGWERVELIEPVKSFEPPLERTVLERATIMNMGFHEDEAQFAFYRLAPLELNAITAGGLPVTDDRPVVYPVMGVHMPTQVFMSLIARLKSVLDAAGGQA